MPDPAKWEKYFDKIANKQIPPQSTYRAGIISIEEDKPGSTKSELVTINAITPVERTVEQAKSELRRHGIVLEKSKKRKEQSLKRKQEEERGENMYAKKIETSLIKRQIWI